MIGNGGGGSSTAAVPPEVQFTLRLVAPNEGTAGGEAAATTAFGRLVLAELASTLRLGRQDLTVELVELSDDLTGTGSTTGVLLFSGAIDDLSASGVQVGVDDRLQQLPGGCRVETEALPADHLLFPLINFLSLCSSAAF